MPSSPLSYFLWFLGTFAPLATAVIMKRRNLVESFPTFFTFNCFQAVGSVLLFAISKLAGLQTYYLAYWVNAALGIGLGFFVIREVFINMLRPYAGLRDAGMLLFRWAAVFLLVFSAISFAAGSGSEATRVTHEISVLQRNVLLIQCGLLLFVVMCSNYLNISWKSLPCGVAFGFGLFGTYDLFISNMVASRGWLFSHVSVGLFAQMIWTCSTLLWLSYSLMPQPERKAVHDMTYRPVVDRWNQAAMLIMNSEAATPSPNTYLSDIERTVEAVLAHSNK